MDTDESAAGGETAAGAQRPFDSARPAPGESADDGGRQRAAPLSHELRTPLHAITGTLELLLDGSVGPLPPQARICLAEAQQAGRQLTQQIHALMLLIDAVAGASAGPAAEVDLIPLLRERLERVGRVRSANVEVAPPDACMRVRGDRAWLEAMAAAITELATASRPRGSAVQMSVAPGAGPGERRLWIGWKAFDPAQMPAVQMALIRAIAQMHGASVGSRVEVGLVLDWPETRAGNGTGGLAAAADDASQ